MMNQSVSFFFIITSFATSFPTNIVTPFCSIERKAGTIVIKIEKAKIIKMILDHVSRSKKEASIIIVKETALVKTPRIISVLN